MDPTPTRQRIIDAADDLFYRQGFEHTSFADIAASVGLSRGNFYYHFKTKDDILDAVIVKRLADTRALLDQWEFAGRNPADRIRAFIHILIANQAKIMAHGCPVGTLCAELSKLDHGAQDQANRLFTLFRTWLARQFALLGRDDGDDLALHLLALSQGVATLANAFRDKAFVDREVRRMEAWLDASLADATPAPI
ncbi:MAG: TetR/AcrR family transcriptional regulator [Rhodobacterales bacterium]|nr:TetR/AcrR family transcriptional regulator [Rhodobacterales bacterium]